jgi:hypothetical protein
VLFLGIANTSKGQSIYKRIIDDDSTIFIFTKIDTLRTTPDDCRIFGMMFNNDSTIYYVIGYYLKAPEIMYLGNTYTVKLFFENGKMLQYKNVIEGNFFAKGAEMEFRTAVEDYELTEIKESSLCMLQLERPGYFYTLQIGPDQNITISKLAGFMLETDIYKE